MSATILSSAIITAPFMSYQAGSTTVALGAANTMAIYPFTVPYAQLVTNICLFIGEGDSGSNTDFGIYDASGNLLGHAGAQVVSTANALSFAISGGPIVIGPGQFFLGVTSTGTTLRWAIAQGSIRLHSTATTSTGGELPSTIDIEVSLDEGGVSPFQGVPPTMILT